MKMYTEIKGKMNNFLMSKDPYIIQIGIEIIGREIQALKHSLSIVSGKSEERENYYKEQLNNNEFILEKLKNNIKNCRHFLQPSY